MRHRAIVSIRKNLDYIEITKLCDAYGLTYELCRSKSGNGHPKLVISGRGRKIKQALSSSPGKPNPHAIRSLFKRRLIEEGLIKA